MDNESSTSRRAGITGFVLGQQKPGKAVAFYTHTHTHTHTHQAAIVYRPTYISLLVSAIVGYAAKVGGVTRTLHRRKSLSSKKLKSVKYKHMDNK